MGGGFWASEINNDRQSENQERLVAQSSCEGTGDRNGIGELVLVRLEPKLFHASCKHDAT
jgi:hypothetical protein